MYASWSGVGVFAVAILSFFFYKQILNWQTVIGLVLVVVGITIINVFKTPV
ncbi:MAG: SMR family transporter [Pseudomonadota bacterium]|nr:SMR family transporter [Pseudomonadota bacterium]